MELVDFWQTNSALQTFLSQLKPRTCQLVTGLTNSAKALFLANLVRQKKQPLLVVEPDTYHASQLYEDLVQLLEIPSVHLFPVEATIATQIAISSPEALSQRLAALDFLRSQQAGVVVTSVAGLEEILPAPTQFDQAHFTLTIGASYPLEQLPEQLVAMGYQRQNLVANPGEFAIRGDIVDVYPLTGQPVRIEFFDDQVETLHFLDPASQRNHQAIQQIQLSPASDRIATSAQLKAAAAVLSQQLTTQIKQITDKKVQQNLQDNFQEDLTTLQSGNPVANPSRYVSYLYPDPANLSHYLSLEGIIVFDDYDRLVEQDQTNQAENLAWFESQFDQGKFLPEQKFHLDLAPVLTKISQAEIHLSLFPKNRGHRKFQQLLDITSRSVQQFFSNLPLLKTEVTRWQKLGYTTVLLINNAVQIQKMQNTLRDFGITAIISSKTDLQVGALQLVEGGLLAGFELPNEKLVVITEKELFNQPTKHHRFHTQLSNAERLKSYTDLKPGDYVVHVNHGIGRFVGIQTLEVDGKHQDYITITYRDDGQLLIPVTQLNMVQKYVSAEGKAPKLNKLGGTEWHKTKQKVQKNIEDIADDLMDLYAQRKAERGFAFSADDDLQKQFDDEFTYVETPDQLRSIQEIKRDMESPHPMDRLLVGDVGFGKTEVALRAAFKAINDGKQVAFLVPTTILAQQHYQTIVERFKSFPVQAAIMSRFQTRTQQTATKKGLLDGSIDIVVGTHRLLSKDIQFADLGLLIVDEEQRFGVKHKERLKQLKSQIDVLTMTATPIPRTLNMSMNGVRDLSVIETAPPNRYPIQTFVMEQNYDVVRSAIERELERGGQVFYLHNRVEDMEQTAQLITSLVPDARVAIANGQLTQVQLEGVISDFLAGEYDVLITTTIIETGVDMPNANTLIVENADHYGLAQLYQLRGRVGRSSRVAYAYFMYRPDKTLTEVGEKRLEAIKNFTELGSGFKIAMRDLAIRGAGNLLGQQQHGFIDSVGYDLYTQMLEEAVAKRRGAKKQATHTNCEVKLDLDAYIPTEYISDELQKIEMYKRLREAHTVTQLTSLQQEFKERFGKYPQEVAQLFKLTQIKLLADTALVKSINQKQALLTIQFDQLANNYLTGEQLFKALTVTVLKARVANEHHYFVVQLKLNDPAKDFLPELLRLMQELANLATATQQQAAS